LSIHKNQEIFLAGMWNNLNIQLEIICIALHLNILEQICNSQLNSLSILKKFHALYDFMYLEMKLLYTEHESKLQYFIWLKTTFCYQSNVFT
jgi:hypothetical protein